MIELSHVSQQYAARAGARARALDDVSLRVAAGEISGLAGESGAGKSTLLRLVLGFEQPTSGSVLVDGLSARRFVEREGMGYVPPHLSLPSRWRVHSALTRLATLSGVRAAHVTRRVAETMELVSLGEWRRARIASLTPDARARLAIAQALLADRRVLVFDDPLAHAAESSVPELVELIVSLRAFDRAVLIASRDVGMLRRLTDRITLLDRGRVRRAATPRPATPAGMEMVFHLVMHHGAEQVRDVFPNATPLGRGAFAVRTAGYPALNRGLRELLERGALVMSVSPAHTGAEVLSPATVGEVVS